MRSVLPFVLCLAFHSGIAVAESEQSVRATNDLGRALRATPRRVPVPVVGHPGNVFLIGEDVAIKIPEQMRAEAVAWSLTDDRGNLVCRGSIPRESGSSGPQVVRPGPLNIGWYRLEFSDRKTKPIGWTSAAVLARLATPVPQDSPICVDSATAWFAKDAPANQRALSRLAALAGVNWVRDRLKWEEIEPEPGRFRETTTYDSSATIHAEDGLKVLQVFHDTPRWAADDVDGRGRFPADLRIAYRSCKSLARRFRNRVQAWEPWNEANVRNFGGHAIDQMCSYQKAAYLGLKAGDPAMVVGWNALAGTPTEIHAQGVLENETWPYFDTYNTHTYDWPESYVDLWKPIRKAACGRPIWITEADRGVHSAGDPPWHDLPPRDERLKAQFMAHSYATSLFAGANRHFHFILGHYCEQGGKVQFGLLRLDHTPRPSYVALAALGRCLAGARCLGKWSIQGQPHVHVFAFRARPDGVERDVLVAWAERPGDWGNKGMTTAAWALPKTVRVLDVFDYLGRSLSAKTPEQLSSAAHFVVLRSGDAEKLPLEPPKASEFRGGTPSSVVLQLRMPPAEKTDLSEQPWAEVHAHLVEADKPVNLELYAYNFGNKTTRGTIQFGSIPSGWKISGDRFEIALAPMQRKRLACQAIRHANTGKGGADSWFKLRGEFSNTTASVLAFRLLCE